MYSTHKAYMCIVHRYITFELQLVKCQHANIDTIFHLAINQKPTIYLYHDHSCIYIHILQPI